MKQDGIIKEHLINENQFLIAFFQALNRARITIIII